MVKRLINILQLVSVINTVLFVPQFSNANNFLIEKNTLAEPDGELGSILTDIVEICFDVDLFNIINHNEEFVEKDFQYKRFTGFKFQFFNLFDTLLIRLKHFLFQGKLFKTQTDTLISDKQVTFLSLLYPF
ncbi:MAG: hypothetical protein ACK4K9_03495 [Bacteroidia bacterium]